MRGGATWAARAAAAAAAPATGGTTKTNNSWAALGDDDHGDDDVRMGDRATADDADGDVQGEEETRPCGDGDGGDGEQQEQAEGASLGEGELRQQWQAHAHACRLMERDPRTFPPPLLATAKAQRDEAERRWRAAKTPHPLHKRLRWAQAELQEAESKEANHRRELQDHLQTVERRTKELQDRLATSSARTARRRAALEAIRLEAAPGERSEAGKAARVAATGITMDVAPQLKAAIERLATPLGGDAESLRQHLQVVAASLSNVHWVLSTAADPPADAARTSHYDISDDGAAAATNGDKGSGDDSGGGGG